MSTSLRAKAKSAGKAIVAHAPCRVDLAGSTLDIWPLYLFHPGAVTINFAVNVLTRCQITRTGKKAIHLKSIDSRHEDRFLSFAELCSAKKFNHRLAVYLVRFLLGSSDCAAEGFALETNSESPAGAGISGSSALMIAITAALARFIRRKLSPEQIRVIAQNVEAQVIHVPTGCQDYYPALYGGVSAIHLEPDGIHREKISIAPEEIESRFILAYTGAPRQSGINNWEVFKAHINGDKRVLRNFRQICEIAGAMQDALQKADWSEIARLLRQEWKLRKTNAPGITTPLIEKLVSAATESGALGAKVCGAGGGGCVVFLTPPQERDQVIQAIRKSGGELVPFLVAREGLTVVSR